MFQSLRSNHQDGSPQRVQWSAPLAWLLFCLAGTHANSQQLPPRDSPPVVAATVNDQPVFVHEVDREIARVARGREIEPQAETFLRAQALQQLVERQLILQWLEQHQRAASDQDVKLATTRLTQQLSQREITLEAYLQRRRMKPDELHRALKWQLSWQRFLDRFLTDENLERYFSEHRRHFDGTELRVAHILLKVDPDDDPRELTEQLMEAKRIKGEIDAGELTFAEAAQQYSAAPTGEAGGDIGLIARHEPMPEAFSSAAFQLGKGQVSEAVVSHFGVHLIQCLEIKPGQKRWKDVRGQLEEAVTRYLFGWAAGQGAADARIEFTGAAPHFKPGTREVQ